MSDRKVLRAGWDRWLKALDRMDAETDPIFAPWFAFAALPTAEFAHLAKELSAALVANSFPYHVNSVVARAFVGKPPTSLQDVAERWGVDVDNTLATP